MSTEIFVKLSSLKTIVVLTAPDSSRQIVKSLLSTGHRARRVGPSIVVVEE